MKSSWSICCFLSHEIYVYYLTKMTINWEIKTILNLSVIQKGKLLTFFVNYSKKNIFNIEAWLEERNVDEKHWKSCFIKVVRAISIQAQIFACHIFAKVPKKSEIERSNKNEPGRNFKALNEVIKISQGEILKLWTK